MILERLGGALEATHARARLVLAQHPVDDNRQDAFWLVGGRLVDWGPAPDDPSALEERTREALKRGGRAGELGAHVPPDEIDELRIVSTYLASHPDTTQLALERDGDREGVYRNGSSTTSAVVLSPSPTVTTVPTGASRLTSASAIGPSAGDSTTLVSSPTARSSNLN